MVITKMETDAQFSGVPVIIGQFESHGCGTLVQLQTRPSTSAKCVASESGYHLEQQSHDPTLTLTLLTLLILTLTPTPYSKHHGP